MSIFERQLRIWGDVGQSRLENSVCLIAHENESSRLMEEMQISLRLAGVKTFDFEGEEVSSIAESKTRIQVHHPSPDKSYSSLLHCEAVGVGFRLFILESLPVTVALFEIEKPILNLAHHDTSIPPFCLTELPLEPLSRRWVAPSLFRNQQAMTEPAKLPWMLILYYCHRSLLAQGVKVSGASLKSEMMNLNCDPECLKQARLHMYWILKMPDFAGFIEEAETIKSSLLPDEAELVEKLQKLGRFPICGELPVDDACDPEVWQALQSVYLEAQRSDQEIMNLASFLRKKGLGCLKVLKPAMDVRRDEEFNILPTYYDSIQRVIVQDEKIPSLSVQSDHLLSSVLSTEASHNANNTILHGLVSVARFQSQPSQQRCDPEAEVKQLFPSLAAERYAREFSVPE